MIKKIKIFLILFLINILLISYSFAAINFVVTPIKQRIELNPWQSITKTAKIRNKENKTVTLKVNVYDLQAENITWKPILILKRKNYIKYPEQTLKNYVTLDKQELTLAPKEEKEVHFTINLPSDISPGWHYWAIVFENYNATDNPWLTWTKVNVFYGSIILLNVPWDTNIEWEIWDLNIDTKHSWLWISKWIDKCPYWDFSKSNYDWKCIDINIIDNFINPEKKDNNKTEEKNNKEKNDNNNSKKNNDNNIEKKWKDYKKNWWKKSLLEFKKQVEEKKNKINKNIDNISKLLDKNDFWIKFSIPIKNKWNTHLHPEWKIILKDENWNTIKKIWKEIISNKKWAIVWYKVVDYLPINDQQWDVFPKKEKILNVEWKWFPYKVYNENWEEEIKYFSPSEYYTKKYLKWDLMLMPWQRVCSRINTKDITAYLEVSYLDENNKKITTKKEKKFKIAYVEKYIWYDYIKLICAWIILFILILFFLLILLNKRKCINPDCKKRLKKDMKVCPYCWTIQFWKDKWKKAKFKK